MPLVFVGLGANLGDREGTIRQALSQLSAHPDIHTLQVSRLIETHPQGVSAAQPLYLNGVCSFTTSLSAQSLMTLFQDIEQFFGRRSKGDGAPRSLDLDLLFYGNSIISEPGLQVPHPHIQDRSFVLMPFMDLDPKFEHPVLKVSIQDLFAASSSGATSG